MNKYWEQILNKYLIFNKLIIQDSDSYFIVDAKENSEVINSTIIDEKTDSNSLHDFENHILKI